jgi:hypothetical protein
MVSGSSATQYPTCENTIAPRPSIGVGVRPFHVHRQPAHLVARLFD